MDNPLFRFDPGIFLWTWIAFIILLGLLGKFAISPVLNALQDREQLIQDSLKKAQDVQQKYDQVQRDTLVLLKKSQDDAAKIIEDATQKARQVAVDIESRAREKAQLFLNAIESDMQQQKDIFYQQMALQISNLSLDISRKVISQQFLDENRARDFLLQSLSKQT